MITLGILFIIIGTFIIIGFVTSEYSTNFFYEICKAIGSIFGSTLLIILGILVLDSEPKAIDVYRDKTELQINMKVNKR